jgi:hypothetical protein
MNGTPANGPATAGTAPQQQAGVSTGGAGVSLPAGTFGPVPATLPGGRAPADISHTWDGVLHAIDDQGAPHVYDRVQQAWNPVGTGIDAAARVGGTIYHFRGPEYVTSQVGANQISAPVLIAQGPAAEGWQKLPRSFQQGVCGAASLGGELYLFAHGRYVCLGQPEQVFALADLRGWPTAPEWAGGVIDGTFSFGGDQVMVFRGGQWVTFSISAREVLVASPIPLTEFGAFGQAIAVDPEVLGPGFRGGFTLQDGVPAAVPLTLYSGPDVVVGANSTNNTPVTVVYPPAVYHGWPDSWNPQLAHAFTGTSGALWSATKAGQLVSLEADGFHSNAQQASQVSAGRDGSVFYLDRAGTSVYALDNPAAPLYTSPEPVKQLSHGRAAEVWALGENGNAVRITTPGPGAEPATQAVFQAQAISANADGSVWHIGPGGQPARYTDTTGASETFPGAPAAGLIASNSAGHGYLVSGASAGTPDALSIHEYTSPFVFKTVGMPATLTHGSVVCGGGRVFYRTSESPNEVIACDYESGGVTWTHPNPNATERWLGADYSETLDCLAVTSSSTGIYMYRASDGGASKVIGYPRESVDDVSISVNGDFATTLSISSEGVGRTGLGAGWDLKNSRALWITAFPGENGPPTAPLITEESVFMVGSTTSLDGSSMTGCSIRRCARNTGDKLIEIPSTIIWSDRGAAINHSSLLFAPIASETFTADEALYFIDGNGSIRASSFEGTGPFTTFAVSPTELIGQGTVQITSDLSYANGCIWFGCTIAGKRGALVGLDTRNGLSLVPNTPFFPDVNATAVLTKPLFYRNPESQPLVVFGTQGVAKLWAFNPVDGSSGSIDTMGTEIGTMTDDAPLGIVYCGGTPPVATPTALTSYYGIRLDSIPLTSPPRYSLVADSQLMQDPDQQATNKGTTTQGKSQGGPSTAPLIPPSVARYQTHITVVDSLRTPVPGLDVKLYVDQATAGVLLTVQGQPVTVPPSGAVVATDATGKITVVSDATDVKTAALRVWAPFMDNSERVVIYPDHEFHQRVMTAHANASDTDPGKVNLVTAHGYNGNPFFTDQEKSSNVPQQTATAVQQMGTATGLGGSTASPATPGALQAGPAKYLAYADMGGASYYPADTIAQRPLPPPAAAFALRVQRAAGGSLTPSVLSLKDAGAVLDSWQQYDPWAPPSAATAGVGAGMLGEWWDDFWNWLCNEVQQVADVIQQIVVTVAEDVRVAIQVIENGIAKVVNFVVKTVEDAVHAIGSFFIQLGKLIMDTIEALSLLFDFQAIHDTFLMLENLVNQLYKGDQTHPGLGAAITNHAEQAVHVFIHQEDQAISNLIDEIKAKLTGNPPVSQLKGQGSTEHDAYQVTPAAGSSSPSPVQGSWASDKMKQHVPLATMGAQAGAGAGLADSAWQLLQDFINGFASSIDSGGLASAVGELETQFETLFRSASLGEFLATAVDVLLDFIKLLLEAALNLAGGLVGAALSVIAGTLDAVWDLINQPITIPFIGDLFEDLIGEEFTILRATLFLVAIPVAIMFRAITGKNPSQAVLAAQPAGGAALGAVSAEAQLVCTLAGIFTGLCGGLLSGAMGMEGSAGQAAGATVIAAFGLAGLLTSTPWISSSNPSDNKIVQFGLSVGAQVPYVLLAGLAIGGLAGPDLGDPIAVAQCVMGIATLAAEIAILVDTPPSWGADVGIALGIAGTLPPIVGLLRVSEINEFFGGAGRGISGAVKMIDTLAVFVCKMFVLTTTTAGPAGEQLQALA